MNKLVARSKVKRLAGLELNALLYSKILPAPLFQGARIRSSGTPVYDISGEKLFYRIPVMKGRTPVAHADVAANPVLGSPLLAVHHGLDWNRRHLLNQAVAIAKRARKRFNRVRFVAYSYPKMAIQFLKDRKETLMLELYTWEPVPPKRERRPKEPPSYFERWSLIEEIPENRKRINKARFQKRMSDWDEVSSLVQRKYSELLHPSVIETIIDPADLARARASEVRELHYSLEKGDHNPCYELRGQLTKVWCVAASVQMVLDFYRYDYQQTRIAQELNLGTINNPNGLPFGQEGDVVTALQNLTSNALSANMNATPSWTEFRNEIRANRPLISFIPGHSRTVVGYHRFSLWGFTFRGLLVYDPWPPTTGVISRWEDFDAFTYRYTFTAHPTLV